MNSYHAHIYFDEHSLAAASDLHQKIERHFKTRLKYFGQLIMRPIGPHPMNMFEIDFSKELFSETVEFLMKNHGDLSVLIHPESGNDLLDHTVHALWLGRQLSLKLEVL